MSDNAEMPVTKNRQKGFMRWNCIVIAAEMRQISAVS
jgi:hypothetical protein